jgi:hypothetical protein
MSVNLQKDKGCTDIRDKYFGIMIGMDGTP